MREKRKKSDKGADVKERKGEDEREVDEIESIAVTTLSYTYLTVSSIVVFIKKKYETFKESKRINAEYLVLVHFTAGPEHMKNQIFPT